MLIFIFILSLLSSTLFGESLEPPKIISKDFYSLTLEQSIRLLAEISHSYLLESQKIPIPLIETHHNLQNILSAYPVSRIYVPAKQLLNNTDYKIRTNGEIDYFYPLRIYIKITIKKIHTQFPTLSALPKEHILKYFLTILENTSLMLDDYFSHIIKELAYSDTEVRLFTLTTSEFSHHDQ